MKAILLILLLGTVPFFVMAQSKDCDNCYQRPGPAYSGDYQAAMYQESPMIYPNPAIDFISLKNPGTVRTLRIFNLVGRELLKFSVEEGARFSIADLPRGMYLVQMLNSSQDIVKTQRINKR